MQDRIVAFNFLRADSSKSTAQHREENPQGLFSVILCSTWSSHGLPIALFLLPAVYGGMEISGEEGEG